jgi:hypothetical protein
MVDVVGGLLGLLGLPCARGPMVDWEAVLWGVMDVQCVLVMGGVGFSCGAPMARPAFAGESDGEDTMGVDACWGRMASRSVIVEGVGAVVLSACGRPTASRSEAAEGVGAIAAGVVGGLMASRSETAEGAGAIVIGSGEAVMASRSETADGEAVLGGMAGSADECSGGTTAVAGWAGACRRVVLLLSPRPPVVEFLSVTVSAGVFVRLCSRIAMLSAWTGECCVEERWELGFFFTVGSVVGMLARMSVSSSASSQVSCATVLGASL